jgi:hypothetical protein
LLSGIGLLSLSGWFITASAVAGLAVAGASFNALYASGGVRAFAVTRTVGRYAERMATHEATFRVLSRLRLWVFDQAAPLAPGRLSQMRSGDVLSRVTQDVDALDNLYLRVVTPMFAAACGALAAASCVGRGAGAGDAHFLVVVTRLRHGGFKRGHLRAGNLKARGGLANIDLADIRAGDPAQAADQRQDPARFGAVLAPDIHFKPGARLKIAA